MFDSFCPKLTEMKGLNINEGIKTGQIPVQSGQTQKNWRQN